ncbi:coiled-coil domain-containing protein R3HCC1L-like isoform X1 [Rhopilema esculentum]|uniref:coiled-coil domain-containing protein R3HCC1L-like isoform X1 n=2 Tax=Rhopilema esculentum TaxID=499914 RepID=UPI0031DFE7C4
MDEDKKTKRVTPRKPDQQLYVPRHRKTPTTRGSSPKVSTKKSKSLSFNQAHNEVNAQYDVAQSENKVCSLTKTCAAKCPANRVDLECHMVAKNDAILENIDEGRNSTAKLETCAPDAVTVSDFPASTFGDEISEKEERQKDPCVIKNSNQLFEGQCNVDANHHPSPSFGSKVEPNSSKTFAVNRSEDEENFTCKDPNNFGTTSLNNFGTTSCIDNEVLEKDQDNVSCELLEENTAEDVACLKDGFSEQLCRDILRNVLENLGPRLSKYTQDVSEDRNPLPPLIPDDKSIALIDSARSVHKNDVFPKIDNCKSESDSAVLVHDGNATVPSGSTKSTGASGNGDDGECVQKDVIDKHKDSKVSGDSFQKSKSGARKMKVARKPNKVKQKKVETKTESPSKVEREKPETEDQVKKTDDDMAGSDDDWELKWSEEGDCLKEDALDELKKLTGISDPIVLVAEKPEIDYYSFEPQTVQLDANDYSHLVEIYDFSPSLKTVDISLALQTAGLKDFDIKWVDDTHAIGIFSSTFQAQQAMQMNFIQMKVRQIVEGTKATKLKARSFKDMLLPYKPRPETTATVARNLVTSALGVKSNTSKAQREKERQKLKEAKDRKKMEQKQRADAWGD